MSAKRVALAAVAATTVAVALGTVWHRGHEEKAEPPPSTVDGHVVPPAREVARRMHPENRATPRDFPELTVEQRGRIEPSLALLTNLERYATARDDRTLLKRIHQEQGRLIQATTGVGHEAAAEKALK